MSWDMKRCSSCRETKPLDQYNKNRSTKDGLCHQCRPCSKAWYRQNADYAKQKNGEVLRRNRAEARAKILDYKLRHPCVDCGEPDPIVLDFDHFRDKIAHVSRMVGTGRPWTTIEAEIAKCEVRCANCHRRKTHSERGS